MAPIAESERIASGGLFVSSVVSLICASFPFPAPTFPASQGPPTTLLGVRSLDACLLAVRRCWASAFAPRTILARARYGLPAASLAGAACRVCVLLQRTVGAHVTGRVTTRHPRTGALQSVVRATYGLRCNRDEVEADEVVLRPRGLICWPQYDIVERTVRNKGLLPLAPSPTNPTLESCGMRSLIAGHNGAGRSLRRLRRSQSDTNLPPRVLSARGWHDYLSAVTRCTPASLSPRSSYVCRHAYGSSRELVTGTRRAQRCVRA